MSPFLQALQQNNLHNIKLISKIIALSVRAEIENFHVRYLSDEQMKELNPLIRTGIYNALFAYINYENDLRCRDFINFSVMSMPSYWEDPELSPILKTVSDQLLNKKVSFQSEFLNEQYRLGNISYFPQCICMRIKGSFELAGVSYEERKKHLRKITSKLKQEDYHYDYFKYGYVKKLI